MSPVLSIGRFLRFLSALTALLLAANGAVAHSNALLHAETLRVVYTDFPPFIVSGQNGEPDGFSIQVLRKVAARANYQLTFQRVDSLPEALALIVAGKADLHPSLASTAERREIVDYTPSVHVVTLSLYALEHRAASFNPDDLTGKRIGYLKGDATEPTAKAIIGAVPIGFGTEDETVYEALVRGTIDLGVFVDAPMSRQLRLMNLPEQYTKVGAPLRVSPIGIAVSKARPDVLERLSASLQGLKAEAAFDAIRDRWFGPPDSWWTLRRVFFVYLSGITVVVLVSMTAFGRLRRTFRRGLNREMRLRATLATRHAAMLELKNTQLAAQNDEMQRLLQAVSHDLKSPMVTVRGFAGVLQDAMESGDQDLARDACRRIVASTGHLSGITDGLQEYNRVDQKPIALQRLDLNALVAEAEEMLSADIAKAQARIVVPSKLPHVRADETQLLRVLLNLILNALRYGCPEPGMAIEISAAVGVDTTEIVVRDHGPGIPEAYQRDVFRLFRRLTPGQADGTGIGLSVVARVAAKHGGSAWISSPQGGGAAVHMTLMNNAAPPTDDDEDASFEEKAA